MSFVKFSRSALAICLSFVALHEVSAQTVTPINGTRMDNSTTTFSMSTKVDGMQISPSIIPLTNRSGLTGSLNQLENINPSGTLAMINPSNTGDVQEQSIAYISCEPGDYAGSNIDAARTMNLAAAQRPDAIVLYSIYADRCDFVANGFDYDSLYTMMTAGQSNAVLEGLEKHNPAIPPTSISLNTASVNASGQGNDNGAGGNVLGKSPTTAVAMIILYSITGIITFLFLAIIVIGAIRAHRHPERYGPRRMIGRPRQSRARGIARAMLETLPIVKFGDPTDDKPPESSGTTAEPARDVELGESRDAAVHAARDGNADGSPVHATGSHTQTSAAGGPDAVITQPVGTESVEEGAAVEPDNAVDSGLACSVCTDDFVKGQDIRLLPCKHKFHPECIDPWLLNVSGTCPLCRVDLQPRDPHAPGAEDEEEFDDGPTLETLENTYVDPVEPNTRRHRRSRILSTLNIRRMRHATPEERIDALRRLRSENLANESNPEQGSSTLNRFSRRFSRALGGSRPHSGVNSRRASEIPPITSESAVPATAEVPPPTPTVPRRSPLASGAATPSERNTIPAVPRTTSPLASETESEAPAATDRTSHPTAAKPPPINTDLNTSPTASDPPAATSSEAATDETSDEAAERPSTAISTGAASERSRHEVREYHLLSPITSASSGPR